MDPSTKRFAVDFVILLPDHVMDIAISLNKRACKHSYIALDREKCFPHVSLLMGCLRADDLMSAEMILNEVTSQHKTMALTVADIRTVKTGLGDVMTLDIERCHSLQLLHESLVNKFTPHLSNDAREPDVFDSPANATTLGWINEYIPYSCFEKFWPHITVGYIKENTVVEKIEPFMFTASRIAMCHLGNYCTCKRIFAEARLAV